MRKTILILSSLIALVLLAWFTLSRVSSPEPAQEEVVEEIEKEAAAVEEAAIELENPIEGEIPDVNPAANTNPFGGVYINPFE